MSDPVTNVEIEDVLASIRRLVSQGDRPESRPEKSADATAPAPATDRLVLTPALRVAEPEREDPQDDVAEFEVEEPGYDEETEPEDTAGTSAEETVAADMASSPAAPLPGTEIHWDTSDASANRASLLATIAELEAAVGGSDTWEPDGSEREPQVDWEDLAGPPRFRDVEDDAPEVREDETRDRTVIDLAGLAERTVRTEPSVERAEAPADDMPTPGSEGADDLGDDLDEDLSSYLSGDPAIDEETLRDMVAEIVREELQGALGERITRNVRKLVRREIYRILSSQDFD